MMAHDLKWESDECVIAVALESIPCTDLCQNDSKSRQDLFLVPFFSIINYYLVIVINPSSIHYTTELRGTPRHLSFHPSYSLRANKERKGIISDLPLYINATFAHLITMPKPLIAVIGLGEMGIIHARNLSKLRTIRLALFSTRPTHLSLISAQIHPDRTYTTLEQPLTDPDLAAVVIATPIQTHPNLVSEFANAGKHVFCEKPLALDSDSIREVLAVVKGCGVKFMMGFQRRFDPPYVHARKRIMAGEIGFPVVLKFTSGDPDYPVKYITHPTKHSIYLDLGVHDIDLARFLTGSEVRTVYAIGGAMTYKELDQIPDYDSTIVTMQMTNGANVVIHLSRAFSYGYNVTSEVVCSAGSIKMGHLSHVSITEMKDKTVRSPITWGFEQRFREAFENEMKAFADYLCNSASNTEMHCYAAGIDALHATLVAEAMVKSVDTGLPQTVIYDKNVS